MRISDWSSDVCSSDLRHQPLDIAVFVDDEADAPFLILEVQQLLVERRAFRDEIGFRGQRQPAVGIPIVYGGKLDCEAQVNATFEIVERRLAHRTSTVLAATELVPDGTLRVGYNHAAD